jgi:hypothetical protein
LVGGTRLLRPPAPFTSRLQDRYFYFLDDVIGIPSTSDICFLPKYTALSRDVCRGNNLYRPWLKNSAGFMYNARTRHLFPIVGQKCTFLSLFHPGYRLWYNKKKMSSVQLFFYTYCINTVQYMTVPIPCTCFLRRLTVCYQEVNLFLTEMHICFPLIHNT